MNRRDWCRATVLAALAALQPRSRRGALLGQQPARPDSAAGDPLYRPDLVQERRVVTEGDNDPVVAGLEHRLKCTCGCNLDIYTCRTTDFTCQYSPALHAEVLDLKARGRNPEEIVAAFVAKYGEQILMAPPARGFNLAAYLLPGAVVASVGALIGAILLRRGARPGAPEPGPAAARESTPTPADEALLRRALADVED